ncbi:MAG: hypothetical protein GY705_18450 [Bacteroidetes bacterium]|nr:hypothetical protein [Bacteroidota bacterium]
MGKILKLLLLISIITINELKGQFPADFTNTKPSGCYAKCLEPEKFDTLYNRYFTLRSIDNTKPIKTIIKSFSIDPEYEKWIKAYKNDSNKILWEIDNENKEVKTIAVLNSKSRRKIAPTLIDTIYIETKRRLQPLKTVWMKIICNNDINNELKDKLVNELKKTGYLNAEFNIEFRDENDFSQDKELRKALFLFQKENNLHIGSITFETLEYLNIYFKP